MNFKKSSWIVMVAFLAVAGAASWWNVNSSRNARAVAELPANDVAAFVAPAEAMALSHAEKPTVAATDSTSTVPSLNSESPSPPQEYTTTSSPIADAGSIEGFTEPYRDIAAAAAEMGTIASINVKEGQQVHAGEVLATMDERVLQAALEIARRSMTAEGALKSAQADLTLKSEATEKLVGLRDRGHASQQELDRTSSDLEVAEARLLAVREDLEVKQLEFRRIEAQIEQRIIRAPMDGIVTELQREPGEFVSPSEPVIARIVQLDPLLIVFSVPLSHRNEIARDQTVPVSIGESGAQVEGVVEYVAPTPDPSNSTVRVKVRVPNPNMTFQSGERAVLKLDSPTAEESPAAETESTPVARRDP